MNVTSRIIIALLIILFCGCDPRYGFIESEFKLSSESRFPIWVAIPSGYTRQDITMTFTFYSHPFLSKVKMTVKGPPPDYKVINEIAGDDCFHPITKKQARDVLPTYVIISVKDMKEVFEKREKGAIIYVSDDPKIISTMQ